MKKYIFSLLFVCLGMYVNAQCVDPTALTATAITETTALLGWTENSTPLATQWEVEIVDSGVTPTGVATATSTVNPFLATSLPSGEDYDFYVRSDCGGGTFSGWAGPFMFSTLPCNFSTISIVSTNECLEFCFFPNGPQFGTFFDFNSGSLPTGWSASPFTVGQPCTTNMVDNTDYFWAQATNGSGVRVVSTNVVDVSLGGTVRFYMRYGADDPDPGCEDPDLANEGVFLQYSIDGGATWVDINTWNPTGVLTDPLYQWLEYIEAIPAAAQTSTTVFRWFQPDNSGTDFDNWGLDNVQISANTAGNFVWDFGDGNTSTAQNPCHTFATPGDYDVSLSVDAANCIASSVATLTVADTVNPIAVCQDITLTLDASGSATITAADIDNGSTDNCGIDTMTVAPDTFTTANGGQNPVILTVTDIYGNVSTCTANVNIPYSCGSIFTDTGGVAANYQNGENITWIFTPDNPGEFVQLNFSAWDVENSFDGMMIFNGPDATFPIIDSGGTAFAALPDGAWTGTAFAPTVITSSDPSGALTIVFTSDGSVNRAGWEASIECVTCPGPAAITIANITANSAEISWTDPAATEWEIEIVPVGTTPTGTGVITTTNPYVATGLASGTEYDVYIRAICGPSDNSAWLNNNFFTTLYDCGDVFTDTGGVADDYSNNELETWTFYPGALGAVVTLDFTFVDIESGWDFLSIYDGVDITAPVMNNNVLAPETFVATNTDGAITVQFDSDGSVTRDGWIADIICFNPCTDPSNLMASNPTGTTIDLAWTENGGATQWEVEAVPTGIAPTGVGVVAMTNPYTVTGLMQDTTYDFYVTAICNPGVSESYQVGLATETTLCDGIFTGITLQANSAPDMNNEISVCDQNIDLFISGGFIPSNETYQWQVSNDGGVTFSNVSSQTTDSYTDISDPGIYQVIITKGNCMETFQVILTADCIIPTGFSPNGDNINDTFDLSTLAGSGMISNIESFEAYNRNGTSVYHKNDYRNEWTGDELPVGTYYFIAKLRVAHPEYGSVYKGWVYINREK